MKDLRWKALVPSAGFIAKGLGVSILLSLISVAVGFIIAIPIAAARAYGTLFINSVATFFFEVIRCPPDRMVLFWIYFVFPRLTGDPIDAWVAAILAPPMIAPSSLATVARAG